MTKLIARTSLLVCTLLMLSLLTQAQTLQLSYENTNSSNVWQIQGERTLVINGFDLTPLQLPNNPAVSSLSLDVVAPVAGQSVQAVVYGDANGGAPSDSTLLGSQTVTIAQAGVNRITFNTPISITAPVIWVGFYLPIGFEFNSDTSGASELNSKPIGR